MKQTVSRNFFLSILIFFLTISASAQTLVTYGKQSISKAEFLKAYRKNNTVSTPSEKSYRDYLELYTRYKIKVQEAYDLKLDSLPNQQAELQNFRNQIVDQYLHDETSVNRMVNEAFMRSQKDIHIAQIFIASPRTASPADTLKAYKKAMEAYKALAAGKNFADIAAEYSEDPFAKTNKGDMGYITVFVLPYELETLAYNTAPGKFSKPYHGRGGYHIFKNMGERKAFGRIKVSQILLVFPYNASESAKFETKQRADSIYNALMKGSNFADLARRFSGDNLSYQSGGEIPEFGVGRYEAVFENAAFDLKKEGEISHPVATAYGYHILKLLERKPVSVNKDKATIEALKRQVMSDPRIEISRKEMLQYVLRVTKFRKNTINEDHLWTYTDSALKNKSIRFPDLDNKTVLFFFAKKNIIVKDWIDYRKGIRNVPTLTNGKTNKELLDQYQQAVAMDYYRNHLEDYNKDFANQLKEFKDGNLLFEIMQREVWDKASTDSIGLKNFYENNANNYWWQPSADAIIFTCTNERTAKGITDKMGKNQFNWRRTSDSTNGMAQADSGRFELTQLPPPESGHLQKDQFTSMVKNQADNSITMAYIIRIFDKREPRTYNEARGLIINDYQAYIEDKWIAELKKKYPIKVNEAVFKTLPK
ncbi:MAG TPA: peptidylprolyl isomerase [Puia sp.]|nr:peptidylprolyl isomerase [Puia sp.]